MPDIMDNLKTFLMLILIVYSIVVSMLYWHNYKNIESYQKEKEEIILQKEKDLINRESIVVDKEICFRELTKLKTIQSTALDVLKSYAIDIPENKETKETNTTNNTTTII